MGSKGQQAGGLAGGGQAGKQAGLCKGEGVIDSCSCLLLDQLFWTLQ